MANADYKDAARKRASQRMASSWFKLKEGDNSFRILPTPAGSKTQPVWTEYSLHREVGPKKTTVRCGKVPATGKGACWICDTLIPKLEAKGQDARADGLRAREVFLVQVAKVDYLDNETLEFSGPFLFTPAKGVADQILASIIGSKKRVYEDATKGYNLTLSRTGTGRNDTRYGMIEPDVEPSKVPSSLIAKLKPFDELKEVPKYSEAAQKAAYSGVDAAAEEDEDDDVPAADIDDPAEEMEEEEAPVPRRRRVAPEDDDEEEAPAPKPKKKPATVDDDDEEEAPAPKPKKKPAPVDEDIEDDDLEQEVDELDIDGLDDEEEAPAPKPKKRPVVEDDDEEEAPAPKPKKKPAPVDEDDEEEAPAPRTSRRAPPPAPRRNKR